MEAPRSPVRITGFTRVPRIEAIAHFRDAISSCGGFVLDSHMYSNSMIAISFEIQHRRIEPLVNALGRAGLTLSAGSAAQVGGLEESFDDPALVVPASLSVNFIHDDPPIRIEVPAVPG